MTDLNMLLSCFREKMSESLPFCRTSAPFLLVPKLQSVFLAPGNRQKPTDVWVAVCPHCRSKLNVRGCVNSLRYSRNLSHDCCCSANRVARLICREVLNTLDPRAQPARPPTAHLSSPPTSLLFFFPGADARLFCACGQADRSGSSLTSLRLGIRVERLKYVESV